MVSVLEPLSSTHQSLAICEDSSLTRVCLIVWQLGAVGVGTAGGLHHHYIIPRYAVKLLFSGQQWDYHFARCPISGAAYV